MPEEKDINDIFNDVLLIEEKLIEKAYEEGFQQGALEGNTQGYHLGYHRGAELGAELGYYSSFVEIYLSKPNLHEKALKILLLIQKAIESFPRYNCEEIDIIQLADDIRAKFKKACALLKVDAAFPETDKLTF